MTTGLGLTHRQIRPLGVLAAALAIAAGSYLLVGLGGEPGGSRSLVDPGPAGAPGAVPLAGLAAPGPAPGTVDDLDRAIATWSASVEREPRDFVSAVNLALAYHQRGLLTSNLDDLSRALAAARRALASEPSFAPARLAEAQVLFSTHDFAAALAAGAALIADDPTQPAPLAIVADSQLELGRLDEARLSYDRLARLVSSPGVDIRLARLAFLTGDVPRAVELARAARAAAAAESSPDLPFYDYALGETARVVGDATLSRAGFEAALDANPTDLGALVGLARVEAYEGRVATAIELLRRAAAIAPQPETMALLGDLLAADGDAVGAAHAYGTVRFTGRLGELAGVVYDRQVLLFELDHGGATEEVLGRAWAGWRSRPDAHGHDVVAWALHRLGRDAEARDRLAPALATGLRSARILFHAGAIDLNLGDRTGGSRRLREALAAGPALDPNERAEAEALLDP